MEDALLMILEECTLWRGLSFLHFAAGEVCDECGDGSAVYGFGREGESAAKIGREVGGDEDGGGVEEDDVAAWAGLAGEDGAQDAGVGCGVAALKGVDGGAVKAEIFGEDGA